VPSVSSSPAAFVGGFPPGSTSNATFAGSGAA